MVPSPAQVHQPQPRTKRRFRPVVLLLTLLARYAPEAQPRVQKSVIRAWYQFLSAPGRAADVAMMNYGYAPLGEPGTPLELAAEEEANRYGIALYHRVAGAVDLRGKDVLEIGCGRGGGAAFIKRQFAPRSVTGVDFAEKAIAFCRRRYAIDGLQFVTGDAERLTFPEASFDAVVNVESSHCYPHFDRFVQEVKRVLRPTGHFLFADFRPQPAVESLRDQLRLSGLTMVEEERITPNVVRALDLDTERRVAFAQRHIPGPLRDIFNDFAGVRGSQAYQEFQSAKTEYLRFVLQKV